MIVRDDISKFHSIKPAYYQTLKQLRFSRTVSEDMIGPFEVELVLSQYAVEGSVFHIKLLFEGVFGENIYCSQNIPPLQIEIEDVRNMQLEGARYRVTDVESKAISFFCKSFTAELMNSE